MSGAPEDNVDRFRHRPAHEIAALLPNREAVQRVIDDLRAAGVDVSTVQILHGSEGARILDATGAEHGLKTRIVRFLQKLGYDELILAVYEEALVKDEALLTVPCSKEDRYRLGQLLIDRGGARRHLLRRCFCGDADGALREHQRGCGTFAA